MIRPGLIISLEFSEWLGILANMYLLDVAFVVEADAGCCFADKICLFVWRFTSILFSFYAVRMSFIVIISAALGLPSLENLISYITENLCGYLEYNLLVDIRKPWLAEILKGMFILCCACISSPRAVLTVSFLYHGCDFVILNILMPINPRVYSQ